jgi:hypothetical protein
MTTKRFDTSKYDKLVEKGCLCGSERPQDCELHGPGDNRGLRAFFEAGMPSSFPLVASCAICDAESLMFPDTELDDPTKEVDPAVERPPTLICPRCSAPSQERSLRTDAEEFGYELNSRAVFGVASA